MKVSCKWLSEYVEVPSDTQAFCDKLDLTGTGVEGVDEMSLDDARKAAIDAVKQLSKDVGIPADLKEIVKSEDVDFLSQSAFDDACRPGNPRDTSVAEIKELYLSLM